MQKTGLKKSLLSILCIVLIAAMALFTTGCNDSKTNKENPAVSTAEQESTTLSEEKTTEAGTAEQESTTLNEEESTEAGTVEQEINVLGEGKTEFLFTVTDADGKETSFTIHTDKKTVGEALLDVELIAGDEGDYGLYVKTVNGLTVDYDKDGKYWAFYIDGEYAPTGVDSTDIKEGSTYSFKVE